MKTITRSIKSFSELQQTITFLNNQSKFPLQVTIKPGKEPRRAKQNRLAFQWYKDAAEQGDQTMEQYRCECKLRLGVPIMREDDDFRVKYDQVIKELPYVTKLALMGDPFNFPITSLMTVTQFTQYLDSVWNHFCNQGFQLTDPNLLGIDDYEEWARELA